MIGVECSSLSRIIERWIEITHAVVGFIRVRSAIPAKAEVQGQAVGCAPVVLNIRGPGNVVPEAVVLHGKFLIALRQAEQEIRETVSAVRTCVAGEGECPLGRPKEILDLLIDGPAPAKPKLVRSSRPGNVVANLIIIGLIAPRPA